MLHIETGTTNELLRKISQPVRIITKDVKKLLRKMEDAMHAENGIGLAAPQVGVQMRIILITLFREVMGEKGPELVEERVLPMINPEITAHSDKMELGEEGCLSVPGFFDKVSRYTGVEVTYLDISGKTQKLRLTGLNAREVQHEIDHLDGKLFTDYLSEEKKEKAEEMVMKKRVQR